MNRNLTRDLSCRKMRDVIHSSGTEGDQDTVSGPAVVYQLFHPDLKPGFAMNWAFQAGLMRLRQLPYYATLSDQIR